MDRHCSMFAAITRSNARISKAYMATSTMTMTRHKATVVNHAMATAGQGSQALSCVDDRYPGMQFVHKVLKTTRRSERAKKGRLVISYPVLNSWQLAARPAGHITAAMHLGKAADFSWRQEQAQHVAIPV